MALVNVSALAKAMNVGERRIEQLVHEGMPREGRGRYDLGKCLLWYVRFLQKALEARRIEMSDGELASYKEEKLALLRIDRELREIELAQKRKELVAIDDVEKAYSDMALTIKARMMGVPARLAAELVGETSRVMIQAKIEKEVWATLAQLAKSPHI
jgi:phage terminase Nu1 subunit (DNA packaging protein)